MPISLYRKWRPQKFGDVVNQKTIIKTLEGALKNNRVTHAYLFSGPKGTGKTTIARLLAKAVNCLDKKSFEPCNKCESCKEINENRSLDIFEIDAASHRGIDEIRDLIEKIKFTPNRAKYKVFVIDEVHMLTREAFNALLKTLEEPPAHAIFILATTESFKIPPTVLSRCQRFDFRRINASDIEKQLEKIAQAEKIKIEKGGALLIAQNSEGSMRDAIGFLDQLRALTQNKITISDIEYILGITGQKSILKFLDLIFDRDAKKSIELISQIFEKGQEFSQLIKDTISEIRKIILVKSGIDAKNLNMEEEEGRLIQKWAEKISLVQLLKMIKVFRGAEENLKMVTMPQLALEIAVVEIIEPEEVSEKLEIQIPDEEKVSDNKPKIILAKEEKPNEKKNKSEKETPIVKINIKSNNELIKSWPKIIEMIKKDNSSLSAIMKLCVPLGIKNGNIVIGTKFKLYEDKIKQKKDVIESIIQTSFGKNCSIVCEPVDKENQNIYNENLKKVEEEERKIEVDLEKNTFEVFGE
jgi:DNA polymerase-3 subunit gamma/tau